MKLNWLALGIFILNFLNLVKGNPLFITELLEDPDRNLSDIQERAFVKHAELKDFRSYSGYFTVNKSFNSNLFFWYFEVRFKYV